MHTAATAIRNATSVACVTTSGAINSATRFMTLISGLRAGPAVSLNGSPTVSPMTAALCASLPLPPKCPSSMYFLALSQAPPEFDSITASSWPVRIAPARNAPSASPFSRKPAMMGESTASRPGVISSRSDVLVQMSTTRAVVRLLRVDP